MRVFPFADSVMLPLALAATILVLSGCPKSRFSRPFIDIVAKVQDIPPSGTATAIANCAPSAKRIGGGFLVNQDSTSSDGLVVRGSYPNESNGWTVEVDNTSPVRGNIDSVEVVAYCLVSEDIAPSVTVQRNSGPFQFGIEVALQNLDASCPSGYVVTGGGFRIDGPLTNSDAQHNAGILASLPSGSGWHLDLGDWFFSGQRLYSAYAVCTSVPLRPGNMSNQQFTLAMAQGFSGATYTFDAKCQDPSSFVTAGGFSLGQHTENPHRALESVATSEFTNWTVTTFSPAALAGDPTQATALCLPIP